MKRIYIVEDERGNGQLVRATTKASAIRAIASEKYTAKVATQDQLVELVKEGTSIIEAGEPSAKEAVAA